MLSENSLSWTKLDNFQSIELPDLPVLNSLPFCSYGFVDPGNPNDCLYQSVELLPTDRLMGFKKQIVEQAGFGVKEVFPLLLNRFPTQVGRCFYLNPAEPQNSLRGHEGQVLSVRLCGDC
jgi:hypothetical protein